MIKIFLLIELCFFNNLFTKYFIQGYYSWKRYFKSSHKSLYIYHFFILICVIIDFHFKINLGYIVLIANIPLYIFLPKVKIKYKRRGLMLFLVLNLFSLIYLLFTYITFFSIILNFLLLPLVNCLMLPLETKIQKKYLYLARKKIHEVNPLIIGITGSFGKTTFKEYLYCFLKNKYYTQKSPGNVNTLMGLTSFINNELNKNCEVLILEIGIDENHGILKFKKLCNLDIAIIVGVGKVHLATFKTLENIVNSKCEIESLLKKEGVIFLNGEYNALINRHFEHQSSVYYHKKQNNSLNKFQETTIEGVKKVGEYLNIEEKYFKHFINNIPIISRRFTIRKVGCDIIINDSYNINRDSLKESIDYLEKQNGTKIIITGGLIELGNEFYNENYQIGLRMKNIDYLILLTQNKNHPLAKAYRLFNKKLYIRKNLSQCVKIVNNIDSPKIILITAKGSDYFLK